jgi:hypothetical protein
VCNLYNLDKGQDALRRFFKVAQDDSGNQPPLPWVFPDKFAPIVRQAAGKRIMEMRQIQVSVTAPPNLGERAKFSYPRHVLH